MTSPILEFPLADRLGFGLAFLVDHLTGHKGNARVVRKLKSRVIDRFRERHDEPEPRALEPVEEVEADLPVDEFKARYLRACRPVIIRGLARDWPCVRKWDPEFFYRRYASSHITLHDNEGLVSPDAAQSYDTETMGSYLQRLQNGRAGKYLKFSQFLYDHPELMEDLDLDLLHRLQGNLTRHADYQLFIGGQGSYTPVHCGLPGNLFIQVYGRKTWRLYPSRAYPAIDPPAARLFYFFSHVDPYDVDRGSYPLFPFIHGYEVKLEAGDLFWNPPFWWHCVTNDTDSIAIAYRFNSLPLALRCSRLLTLVSFMATNPTIVEHAIRLLFKNEKKHLTEDYSRQAEH